jgi:hypothetical protein
MTGTSEEMWGGGGWYISICNFHLLAETRVTKIEMVPFQNTVFTLAGTLVTSMERQNRDHSLKSFINWPDPGHLHEKRNRDLSVTTYFHQLSGTWVTSMGTALFHSYFHQLSETRVTSMEMLPISFIIFISWLDPGSLAKHASFHSSFSSVSRDSAQWHGNGAPFLHYFHQLARTRITSMET